MVRHAVLGALLLALVIQGSIQGDERLVSVLKSDEVVLFFPTAARLSEDGQVWVCPVHAWIYEPEEDSFLRNEALRQLREVGDLGAETDAAKRMRERLRPFLVDNERGKAIVVRLLDTVVRLPPSAADGHAEGEVRLPVSAIPANTEKRLTVTVVLPAGDDRLFQGTVQLLSPEGWSVVSDIDDTIKISQVTDKRKLLRNTFCEPHRAVPGMADRYRQWQAAGAQFHFVSNSPYQLFASLSDFASAAGFPDAAWRMRRIRLKDSSILKLVESGAVAKRPVLEALLRSYPRRRFIFVGDTGEEDPEVYGTLARDFPEQVAAIFLRDVTSEARNAVRYQTAFAGVPADRWQLFDEPSQMRRLPGFDDTP